MSEIKYFKHKDIDKSLWDHCILNANNGLIYAMSWYLDAVADSQWDALIFGNYEAVFPLPKRRKLGISYIYQPFFCQQLGLFSRISAPPPLESFLKSIPRIFKKIHLQINPAFLDPNCQSFRRNYTLNLGKSYGEIQKGYNRDARQNIRKYALYNVAFIETQNHELALQLHQNTWGKLDDKIKEKDYNRFIKACESAKSKGALFCIEARLENEVLGAAIFMKGPKRIHYLVSGPTEAGRKLSIMHGIIDYVIKLYADSSYLLDFEGSEIPQVAVFYEKWGSTVEKYQILNIIKL